jgi:hypothetical protein
LAHSNSSVKASPQRQLFHGERERESCKVDARNKPTAPIPALFKFRQEGQYKRHIHIAIGIRIVLHLHYIYHPHIRLHGWSGLYLGAGDVEILRTLRSKKKKKSKRQNEMTLSPGIR